MPRVLNKFALRESETMKGQSLTSLSLSFLVLERRWEAVASVRAVNIISTDIAVFKFIYFFTHKIMDTQG